MLSRVAVVQAEILPDLVSGIERTRALTGAAAREGAALVVFPETWLPGYPAWLDAAGHYHHPDCLELIVTRRRTNDLSLAR